MFISNEIIYLHSRDLAYFGRVLSQNRMTTTDNSSRPDVAATKEAWIDAVRRQVGSLRFGVVQIVVHDARVVQIERTEKIRFDKTEAR